MSSKPQLDPERIAEAVLMIVTAAIAPQAARLKALEEREPRDGQPGLPGRDGRDTDPAVVQALIQDAVAKAVASLTLPVGERGPQGEVGPVGPAGERGEKGEQGEAGPIGRTGEAGPPGERGEKGAQGERGDIGPIGLKGDRGPQGLPGERGLIGERGERGEKGEKGLDGVALDFWSCDITRTYDPDTRMFTDRYQQGDKVKEMSWHGGPVTIFRGVYDPTKAYEAGDQVTYAGSMWIAKRATMLRPDESGDGSRDWTLSTKRGRQGEPGKPGKNGTNGINGKDGRNLTPFDPRG